jgi:hypothetical protein
MKPYQEHWSRVRADLVRQGLIACDVACLYATEPACTCSCGGKNHGTKVPKPELDPQAGDAPVDGTSPLARLERLDVDAPTPIPPGTVLERLEQCELITA